MVYELVSPSVSTRLIVWAPLRQIGCSMRFLLQTGGVNFPALNSWLVLFYARGSLRSQKPFSAMAEATSVCGIVAFSTARHPPRSIAFNHSHDIGMINSCFIKQKRKIVFRPVFL